MAEDDGDQLLEGFKNFVKLGAAGKKLTNEQTCQMNAKAAGKMARDLMDKGVSERVDSSVFPVFKDKRNNYMLLTKDTCEAFIKKCAHEQCKMKSAAIKADDQKVIDKAAEIRTKVISTAPKKNATGTSKTGNVSGLTDSSKYTGSHKERFDAEGKGKGIDGRENLHENTGYVGQYKGKDTFDGKH